MSSWFRRPPSQHEIEAALLVELSAYSDATRSVPNAWSIELAERDARRLTDDLPRWSTALAERLLDEHSRLGLPPTGLVTVAFSAAPDLTRGRFRITGALATGAPAVERRPELVRGRPRLTISAGGQVRHGSPAAAGIDREVILPAGAFVVGRDQTADLQLQDTSVAQQHIRLDVSDDVVRLTDLRSGSPTLVDGVPALETELVNGDRIELGETTLVFHRDNVENDDGDPVSASGIS